MAKKKRGKTRSEQSLPVIIWGTYDLGKPRVRILLKAAQQAGIEIYPIHTSVWNDIEDKSCLQGRWKKIKYLIRWLFAYPGLIIRYLQAPKHNLIFIPYMGHLDIVLLRPFASLRGAKIVWDSLLLLHDTIVEDRALVKERSLMAKLFIFWDRLSLRCADWVITATQARTEQYISQYGADPRHISSLLLSTEFEYFQSINTKQTTQKARPKILFYGQFSPFHGLSTVLQAANSVIGQKYDWVFIGTGQEGWKINDWIQHESPGHVQWIHQVPYKELEKWIQRSDICLGHFGNSAKATAGLPNKVYQIIAGGKPLITRDSPAIRELLQADMPGVFLIPPANSNALIEALEKILVELPELRNKKFHQDLLEKLTPLALGRQLQTVFLNTVR